MIEETEEVVVEVAEPAPTVHELAQGLIVQGYLPAPFTVCPHDGRALWDFCGLAVLLDQRPDALVELLLANGPVHLHADRGIPSSWQSLIERYGPT